MEEIISDSSKFEKLNEDPTLKREASLQRFLRKLKQKNFFNEIEYEQFYPFGCAPAPIYDTPKMHKFSSSDSFPKPPPIVTSIGTFNYNLARFLLIFFHLKLIMITLPKILFVLFLKLRMQVFLKDFMFPTM